MRATTELTASTGSYGMRVKDDEVYLTLFSEDLTTSLRIPLHLLHGAMLRDLASMIEKAQEIYYRPIRGLREETNDAKAQP